MNPEPLKNMFLIDRLQPNQSVLPGIDMKRRALAALRTEPENGNFLFIGYSPIFSALMFSPLQSVVRFIHAKRPE